MPWQKEIHSWLHSRILLLWQLFFYYLNCCPEESEREDKEFRPEVGESLVVVKPWARRRFYQTTTKDSPFNLRPIWKIHGLADSKIFYQRPADMKKTKQNSFHPSLPSFDFDFFSFLCQHLVWKEIQMMVTDEMNVVLVVFFISNLSSTSELEGKLVMLDVAEPKVEKDRHAIPKWK